MDRNSPNSKTRKGASSVSQLLHIELEYVKAERNYYIAALEKIFDNCSGEAYDIARVALEEDPVIDKERSTTLELQQSSLE